MSGKKEKKMRQWMNKTFKEAVAKKAEELVEEVIMDMKTSWLRPRPRLVPLFLWARFRALFVNIPKEVLDYEQEGK